MNKSLGDDSSNNSKNENENQIPDEDFLNESDLNDFLEVEKKESGDQFQKIMEEIKISKMPQNENPNSTIEQPISLIKQHFSNPVFQKETKIEKNIENLKSNNSENEIMIHAKLNQKLQKLILVIKRRVFREFTLELREISKIVDKFLNHCAKLIQTFYRVRRLKKQDGFTSKINAVVKGWKTRKIITLSTLQNLKLEILETLEFFNDLLQEGDRSREYCKQVYTTLCHKRYDYINSLENILRTGKWVNIYKREVESSMTRKNKRRIIPYSKKSPIKKPLASRSEKQSSEEKVWAVEKPVIVPLKKREKQDQSEDDFRNPVMNIIEKKPNKIVNNPSRIERNIEEKGKKDFLQENENNDDENQINEAQRKKSTQITNQRLDWSKVESKVNCWNEGDSSGKSKRIEEKGLKNSRNKAMKRFKISELEKAFESNYSKKLKDLRYELNKSNINFSTVIPFIGQSKEGNFFSLENDFYERVKNLEYEFKVLQNK